MINVLPGFSKRNNKFVVNENISILTSVKELCQEQFLHFHF